MYNVNDIVVYSPNGVCRIDEITKHDFSGEPIEYYVLHPVSGGKNTYYVPTHNGDLASQMRKTLSPGEIKELLKNINDTEIVSIDNENEKREQYKTALKNGDCGQLLKLVKALYITRHDRNIHKKKLNSSDEHFLKDAENLLCDEFSYVLNISKEQAFSYIRENI